MRKELQTAAALAALLAAPALAQNTPPTVSNAGQQTAPGPAPQAGGTATPASPTTQPSATSPGPAPSTAAAPAAGASGGLGFLDAQQDEEMLASTLIDTPVYNAANESLGEINDVLLAADGRLKAVVVGVGGFLGLAERDVAVPWEALQVSRDEDQDLQLRLEVSREQLEQAPPFETVAERRAAEQAARATQNPPAAGLGTPGAGTGGRGRRSAGTRAGGNAARARAVGVRRRRRTGRDAVLEPGRAFLLRAGNGGENAAARLDPMRPADVRW